MAVEDLMFDLKKNSSVGTTSSNDINSSTTSNVSETKTESTWDKMKGTPYYKRDNNTSDVTKSAGETSASDVSNNRSSGGNSGGFELDIDTAYARLASFRAKYADMMALVAQYQSNVDKMADSWVSINGKKAVNSTVQSLNDELDLSNRKIKMLYEKVVNALKILAKREGFSFNASDLELSNKRFNADNAKEQLNGKIYIYVDRLRTVCGVFRTFNTLFAQDLDDMLKQAQTIPLSTYSGSVEDTIRDVSYEVKKGIADAVDEVIAKIEAKVEEQDWDVKMAIANAEAEIAAGK